jgi:hypothetical protein
MIGMKSLNPNAVRKLIEAFSIYPIGCFVKLNTGEQAKVVDTNRKDILRPVVAVLVDAFGKPYKEPFALDLSKEPHIYIVRSLEDPHLEAIGAHVC